MLTLSPITLSYREKTVLNFPGCTLAEGEQCVIEGRSGSGKTSLLYAIAGLILPDTGTISIGNTVINQLSESARDRFRGDHIGIIFQTLHLIKSLTVMQNLLLVSNGEDAHTQKERALKALYTFGLEDKKDALPHQLSQGQAQRIAIIRALLNRPILILADEPTSSLDDESCAQVLNFLKTSATHANATLLIATHDARVKTHFTRHITL